MKIALDYDGTFTEDPQFWEAVIALAKQHHHDIRFVTLREDAELPIDCPIIYTGMKPKGRYVIEYGWIPDVWIDDHPERIF